MTFDIYYPFYSNKAQRYVPGVQASPLDKEVFESLLVREDIKEKCEAIANGDKEKKTELPAVTWCGRTRTGSRKADDMDPTGYYLLDIDHVENPREAWAEIVTGMTERMENPDTLGLRLVHITPSGKGLRIVARFTQKFPTLIEHMNWLCRQLGAYAYGDFDEVVKDISRLSFMVGKENVLFVSEKLFTEEVTETPLDLTQMAQTSTTRKSIAPVVEQKEANEAYADFTFNGFKIKEIAERYVEHFFNGEVQEGRKHAAYNQMVRDFRHLCDNDPSIVYAVLPRFEPTNSDRFSQCTSICKVNNYGTDLPQKFELFLRMYGFIPSEVQERTNEEQGSSTSLQQEEDEDIDDDLGEDEHVPAPLPKSLPPVFREILSTAPSDYIVPTVNGLLPIMGTLTSYLRATYPNDLREHSTEFFSVIYAPPSTGKGFVERWANILFTDLKKRDKLCTLRDQIYNAKVNKKADSKEGPDLLKTQVRIIPSRNSLGEALKKQVANQGHHVFTYAAEVDEWAKGVKAAGADKDDLMRIAWDNGEYGQMFQATNTFKGSVEVYWNLLMCGTLGQVFKYFKNTENGLVSRCSFTPLVKRRYSTAQKWKAVNVKAMAQFEKFKKRCDERTYEAPLDYDIMDAYQYGDDLEAFDREVPYQYKFKPLTRVDLNWLFNEIERWQVKKNKINAANMDEAADDFIPRVMVRGFRLGLICYGLWDKVGEKEKKVIRDFVLWWMEEDLYYITLLWRDRREVVKVEEKGKDKLYSLLPDEFTKLDVEKATNALDLKTQARKIVHVYVKQKLIEKISKNRWKKVFKETN